MKKLLAIAFLALACSSAAKADCYMTSYSVTQNWAQGSCVDYKGNVYQLRTTYWTWLLDYGL